MLLFLLALQGFVLYSAQRHIFPQVARRSYPLALVLAFPGTVLHEGAHLLMCLLLRVYVFRVNFFGPQEAEDGSVTLGYVEHAQTGPLRGVLVSVAPALFVPPALVLLAWILLPGNIFADPLGSFTGAAIWQQVLFIYILLSAASGAFPSPGDELPLLGLFLLGLFVFVLLVLVPRADVFSVAQTVNLLLLPASLSALLQLGVLSVWRP